MKTELHFFTKRGEQVMLVIYTFAQADEVNDIGELYATSLGLEYAYYTR